MGKAELAFQDFEAVRERVPFWFGLIGPSGVGKTYSALRLARGMQQVNGGDIFYIDTEAKRSLHYAYDAKTGEGFKFRHVPFTAPFGSLRYLAAAEYCVKRGAGVIVIDSASHEHEGQGGALDYHQSEMERLSREWKTSLDKVKMTAWQRPKRDRLQMMGGMLQMPVCFIFCFRAKEKLKIIQGKKPLPMGWMPIAGAELAYEMTLSCLLLPGCEGVPTWQSTEPGEDQMIKLPRQFKGLATMKKKPLDEALGRRLAIWATGEPMPTEPEEQTDDGPPPDSEPPREPGSDG